MDARYCKQEVHTYFPQGSKNWGAMAEERGVLDVEMLHQIAIDVIERRAPSDLVEQLKLAVRYREPTRPHDDN